MKKIILVLMLITGTVYSQEEISTTEEEFLFLAEGARDLVVKGLDIKKEGYSLDLFYERPCRASKAYYYYYKLLNQDQQIKGYLLTIKVPDAGPKAGRYIAIPINNDKLFKKFKKQLLSGDEDEIIKDLLIISSTK
jgi:hypothetical protein